MPVGEWCHLRCQWADVMHSQHTLQIIVAGLMHNLLAFLRQVINPEECAKLKRSSL